MKRKQLSPIEAAILEILPKGKARGASRRQLLYALRARGLPTTERHLRRLISGLRENGELICSSSTSGGYYLPADRAEYDEFRSREYLSRIKQERRILAGMDRRAAVVFIPAQQELPL